MSQVRTARDPASVPRGVTRERYERAFTRTVSLDVEVDADGGTATIDFDVEAAGGTQPCISFERLFGARHVEAVDGLEPVAVLQTKGAEQRVRANAEHANAH